MITTADKYEDLVGVPFKHKGRNVKEGLDCLGLVLEIYKRNGKHIQDPIPDYPCDWDTVKQQNYILENYHTNWLKIEDNNIKELDLVLFGRDKKFPTHIAIIIGYNTIIHSQRKHGVIISRLAKLKESIHGFYRLK